jgi:hypothetical protein
MGLFATLNYLREQVKFVARCREEETRNHGENPSQWIYLKYLALCRRVFPAPRCYTPHCGSQKLLALLHNSSIIEL